MVEWLDNETKDMKRSVMGKNNDDGGGNNISHNKNTYNSSNNNNGSSNNNSNSNNTQFTLKERSGKRAKEEEKRISLFSKLRKLFPSTFLLFIDFIGLKTL